MDIRERTGGLLLDSGCGPDFASDSDAGFGLLPDLHPGPDDRLLVRRPCSARPPRNLRCSARNRAQAVTPIPTTRAPTA